MMRRTLLTRARARRRRTSESMALKIGRRTLGVCGFRKPDFSESLTNDPDEADLEVAGLELVSSRTERERPKVDSESPVSCSLYDNLGDGVSKNSVSVGKSEVSG